MAANLFLKLDGMPGESTDSNHAGEIELMSASFGASNPVDIGSGTGGAGVSKVNVHDIQCVTQQGKHSTSLWLATHNGKHIPTGTLTFRKAGEKQEIYTKLALKEVYLSSYHVGVSGDGVPTETFSLSFAEIEYDQMAQDTKGGTKSSGAKKWNLRTNKGS